MRVRSEDNKYYHVPIVTQGLGVTGHITRKAESTNSFKTVVGKPEGKRTFGSSKLILLPEKFVIRVRVRVTLRLAVYRQLLRLGEKTLETHDQYFFSNLTLAVIVIM
jgi:hypothetical protein